jgi:hypothetical protein
MNALELYNQGKPLKSIARELGIHERTVGNLLRMAGYVPSRIGGTRLTPDQVAKSVEMRNSGHSWRAISREVGAMDKTIKRAVENYAAQSLQ